MDNINFVNIQDEEPAGGGDRFEIYSGNDHHQYYFRQQATNQQSGVMNAEEVVELVDPSTQQSQSSPPPVQLPKRTSPPSPTAGFEHWLRNWYQYDLMTMSARKLALAAVVVLAVVALLGLAVYGISRAASSGDEGGNLQSGASSFAGKLQRTSSNTSADNHFPRKGGSKMTGQQKSSTSDSTPSTTTPTSTTTTTTTTTTPKPTPKPKPDPKLLDQITSAADRAAYVRSMTAFAWAAYHEHAWGHSSLKPISKEADHRLFGPSAGRTLINSLSTLSVMNLTDEFETSAEWVRDTFNLSAINKKMNVNDLVTDFMGGLLSAYALTGREYFKEKALEVAKLIEPAYDTTSGLPYEHVNPKRGTAHDDTVWLTWAGGQLLEYAYLEHLFPEEEELHQRVNRIRKTLLTRVADPTTGLFPERLHVDASPTSGSRERFVASDSADFGWGTRQFWAALGKSFLQTDYADSEALKAFQQAIGAAYKAGMFSNYTAEPRRQIGRYWLPHMPLPTTTETPKEEDESENETLLYVHQVKIAEPAKEKEKLHDIISDDLFDLEDDGEFNDSEELMIRSNYGGRTFTTSTASSIITRRPRGRFERKRLSTTTTTTTTTTTERPDRWKRPSDYGRAHLHWIRTGEMKRFDDEESPPLASVTPPADQRKMTYHSCYLGGLLALLSDKTSYDFKAPYDVDSEYQRLARGLTRTCILAAKRSKSGLAPWTFYFDQYKGKGATNDDGTGFYEQAHLMNPEFAETLFTMWYKSRGDPAYREAAWAMVKAMEVHCRTASGGYSALLDANHFGGSTAKQEDSQSPYLFGTLKYLYLIFLDDIDQLLPLERWIFNTVGHPLPIFRPYSIQHNRRYQDTTGKQMVTMMARSKWSYGAISAA